MIDAVFDGAKTPVRRLPAVLLLLVVGASSCAPEQRPVHVRRTTPRLQPGSSLPESSIAPPYVPARDHALVSRLAQIGPRAHDRWKPYFDRAGVTYPPESVQIVALKRERRVEIYAGSSPYALTYLRTIGIEAASGGPGPKLREGDRQVPEGIYEIEKLNPNSAYHVSMRLSYPNAFDQRMGVRDQRRRLGGDIMIHGGAKSIGCIAIGDVPAEDLFVLSADTGLENVSVVIAPRDFRRSSATALTPAEPPWVKDLYAELDRRLRLLPAPTPLAASAAAALGAGNTSY